MSVDKNEFQIIEFKQSNVFILHLNSFAAIALALVLGIIYYIGIFIKGLFVYYVKCKAPKDRPINRMILIDQVKTHQCCQPFWS